MKKYLLLFTFLSGFVCLHAQQVKPELICSGSGIINNGTTNVTWTIGETVVATMNNNSSSLQLTSGIAQPTYKITAVLNNLTQIDIKLFPNPTKDILVLQTKTAQLKNATYTLFDMNGKVIAKDKILNENTSINFSDLAAANYLISINDADNKIIQSYKITKQ